MGCETNRYVEHHCSLRISPARNPPRSGPSSTLHLLIKLHSRTSGNEPLALWAIVHEGEDERGPWCSPMPSAEAWSLLVTSQASAFRLQTAGELEKVLTSLKSHFSPGADALSRLGPDQKSSPLASQHLLYVVVTNMNNDARLAENSRPSKPTLFSPSF